MRSTRYVPVLPADSSDLTYLWLQYLEEDPRVNRIDDSLQLFTAICQNKLLSKAALVLMLNKVKHACCAAVGVTLTRLAYRRTY